MNDSARLAALESLVAGLKTENAELANSIDTAWVLSALPLMFFMQYGFALLETGTVRNHNVIATLTKNVIDLVLGIVLALLIGHHVAYDVAPLLFMGGEEDGHNLEIFVFHVAFQTTAATIVSGSMAERTTILGYSIISLAISMGYCCMVRFTSAVLIEWGFHDFAGSGYVHMYGGVAAITGCAVVGARLGRWDLSMQGDFVPHNIPSVVGGTLILFVGWFSFNAGSTLAISSSKARQVAASATVVTCTASACSSSMSMAMSLCFSSGHRIDVLTLCNTLLSGLVAVTGGCDVIDPPAALAIGVIASLVYQGVSAICVRYELDDVVDAFAVHGANGLWGLIAIGLFHRSEGLFMGGGIDLLGKQLVGALAIGSFSFVVTFITAVMLKKLNWLRVSPEIEVNGLDSEFGLMAYVTKSQSLRRCDAVAVLVAQKGYTEIDVLESLRKLRGIVYRPFTPQAADFKLEGEVRDIIAHLNREVTPGTRHLGFVSHHKADCGDAARIFVDTAKRLLSHGASAASFKQTTSAFKAQELFFLDSSGLKDLPNLLDSVKASSNHILMLSKHTLERPWVIAELCAAISHRKNICIVLVEYPGKQDDPKAFRFPDDLEVAINDWKQYTLQESIMEARAQRVKRLPRVGFFFHSKSTSTSNAHSSLRLSSLKRSDSSLQPYLNRIKRFEVRRRVPQGSRGYGSKVYNAASEDSSSSCASVAADALLTTLPNTKLLCAS